LLFVDVGVKRVYKPGSITALSIVFDAAKVYNIPNCANLDRMISDYLSISTL
jgi:hypothetical protein